MHICIYTYIYIHMFVCIYHSANQHMYSRIWLNNQYVYIYSYTQMYIYIYIYPFTFQQMHPLPPPHTHVCIDMHMHLHIHTHLQMSICQATPARTDAPTHAHRILNEYLCGMSIYDEGCARSSLFCFFAVCNIKIPGSYAHFQKRLFLVLGKDRKVFIHFTFFFPPFLGW